MVRKQTTPAQLEAAIAAVERDSMSLREAARKFNVPRTTLQRKVSRRVPVVASPESHVVHLEPATSSVNEFSAPETTSGDDNTEIIEINSQDVNITGRKRSAEQMETPSAPLQSKGPRKVINCKIRMLCTAAGSALDELSNKMIQEGKAIYKLGLGQSPFPIPQCIVDELRANSHQRDYLPVAGLPELCEDIAAWGAERLHINYSLDDVLVGPGTKELLFVLQTVYYGDLLLPNPSCTSYAPQANIAGRNMMWLPTHAEDHFVLRPEVLEAHCVKDPDAPRILILNSPSNPTGCAYQADELEALAAVARKYRILVVSDEIYSELHHSGSHLSLSKYYPEGTIVSGGLTRCSSGVRPQVRDMMKIHTSNRHCAELASYQRKCQKTLQLIGRWCSYQLQKMDIEVQVPQGGFYLFPCFRRHRKALALRGVATDEQLCAHLLQDTGVAILPGSCFGRAPEELFARLAFVDFKGEIALYLIESMEDDPALEAIEGFIQSVCPNLDVAMRKLSAWMALARPSAAPATPSASSIAY